MNMTKTTRPQCSVEGCERPHEARGICQMHYMRLRRHGEVGAADRTRDGVRARRKNVGPCSVDGCEKPAKTRGWCLMHYMRWYQNGDPGEAAPRTVWGREGPYDKEGYVLWHRKEPDGTRRAVYEHTEVMEAILGRRLEPGENVHHKNGIRNDNRPENLELWVVPPRSGQRVANLVEYVVEHYRDAVELALQGEPVPQQFGGTAVP